jgi:hypothetical protein
MKDALDKVSLDWFRQTMNLGCDMTLAVQELQKRGFSDPAITAGIGAIRPHGNALEGGALPPLLRRNPANLRKISHPGLDIYTLENFLSAKECARAVALISHNLQPSKLTTKDDYDRFRTSTTAELCHMRNRRAGARREDLQDVRHPRGIFQGIEALVTWVSSSKRISTISSRAMYRHPHSAATAPDIHVYLNVAWKAAPRVSPRSTTPWSPRLAWR